MGSLGGSVWRADTASLQAVHHPVGHHGSEPADLYHCVDRGAWSAVLYRRRLALEIRPADPRIHRETPRIDVHDFLRALDRVDLSTDFFTDSHYLLLYFSKH